MKVLFIYLLRAAMAVVYAPLKLLPVNKNKVTFLSRQANEANLDFKLVQQYIQSKNQQAKFVNICKRCDSGIKDHLIFTGCLIKSLYHIATSSVCVLDSYWPPISMLKHKKSLTVVQLWHAMGKIKKSGYQSLGKKSGRDPKVAKAMAMHKKYDFVIASGQAWNPYYCQSFGVNEEVLVNCGLPRTDFIIKTENENKARIFKAYPEFAGKQILLYAPTFRRGWKAHWKELLRHIDFNKYVLVAKSHPNQKLESGDNVYTCDEFSAVELLSVCDYLITDYSAIAVEAAILNRKTFYYVYDYEKYSENNGLNINLFEEMPNCVFKDAKALMHAVETEYPQACLDRYRSKFLPEKLGVSTCTVGDIVLNAMGSIK